MLSKENIQNIYKMSPMQEGMYFHSLYNQASSAYFIQYAYRMNGHLDMAMIEKSFKLLVDRYDILRTVFIEKNGKLLQVVLKNRDVFLNIQDICNLATDEEKQRFLNQFKDLDRQKSFNLGKDMLMRISVIRTSNQEYEFIWSFHHMLMDGWCISILISEFLELYNSLLNNEQVKLPKVIQYRDFIKWIESKDQQEALLYWKKNLQTYEEAAIVPHGKYAGNEGTKSADYCFFLENSIVEKLNRVAMNNHVTLNTVIKTVWAVLLAKYNNRQDVVFGEVVSVRPPEIENIETMLGLFINTVPIRITYNKGTSFCSLIKQVQKISVENESYNYCSLAEVQAQSELKRDLIDHIYVYENFPLENFVESDSTSETHKSLPAKILSVNVLEETNYKLNFIVIPGDEITVKIKYDTSLYTIEQLQRLKEHFLTLVTQVVENSSILIEHITLLTTEEHDMILKDFNNTAATYPKDKSIHQIFEEQVDRYPNNIALVTEQQRMTYRELNVKANQLAEGLRDEGIQRNEIIGIIVERSVNMIVAMLAVLKAGGAYLPIDPSYPAERINYMLEDSKTRIILTSAELRAKLDIQTRVIDLDNKNSYQGDGTNLEPVEPFQLAYCLYTSGTTGKPKAALIEHRNVVRLLINDKLQFDFSSNDVWTLFHSYCFDFSVWEMYGALLYGASLVILSPTVAKDPEQFLKLLKRNHVTILNQTPTAFYNLLNEELKYRDQDLKLKYVIFGGDSLKPAKLDSWKQKYPHTRLINMYGITETTVHVTFKEITEKEIEQNISNIGRPIPTTSVYIMDNDMKLLPIGVKGEMYIGGEGVCRGYLNREEMTMERFVRNPYNRNEILYKTGDMARFLENAEIEYLGRMDDQVKIRGFRIELHEIESALLQLSDIKDAVVVDKTNQDTGKYLCAFVISEKKIITKEINKCLSKKLPSYMIPSHIIQLEKIPLTANGKIDRKNLPEPKSSMLECAKKTMEPDGSIEKTLAEVWKSVLGIEDLTINDNFFMLGGDSIKIIQVASRLNKCGYKLKVSDIYENPTILSLSPYIKELESVADQSPVVGEVLLSPIQNYFFENFKIKPQHYNQSVLLGTEVRLNQELIRKIFGKLQDHHDLLRTVYRMNGVNVVQEIGSTNTVVIQEYELRGKEQDINRLAEDLQSSIDIENGPLMKVAIFHLDDSDYLLIIVHHLIIDAVSWRILFEDMEMLYNQYVQQEAFELPNKTDSYKKWSEELRAYADSRVFLENEKRYWEQVCGTRVPALTEDIQEEAYLRDYSDAGFRLSKEKTSNLLLDVNNAFGTDTTDILVTSVVLGINKTFGNEKIMLMLERHGREEVLKDIDVKRTVGWFTNIYPVLLQISQTSDLSRIIKEIKESLHSVPNNGIGYGILKYLTSNNNKDFCSLNINPQISFNYLGQFDADINQLSIFTVSDRAAGNQVSLDERGIYDLNFNGIIRDNCFELQLNYNNKRYKSEKMDFLMSNCKEMLEYILSYCSDRQMKELTPSDLTYKKLSIDQLESFFD